MSYLVAKRLQKKSLPTVRNIVADGLFKMSLYGLLIVLAGFSLI